jgi:hypothetical protein
VKVGGALTRQLTVIGTPVCDAPPCTKSVYCDLKGTDLCSQIRPPKRSKADKTGRYLASSKLTVVFAATAAGVARISITSATLTTGRTIQAERRFRVFTAFSSGLFRSYRKRRYNDFAQIGQQRNGVFSQALRSAFL